VVGNPQVTIRSQAIAEDPEIDAVIVGTSNALHARVVASAAANHPDEGMWIARCRDHRRDPRGRG
jgi:hypothetical protein